MGFNRENAHRIRAEFQGRRQAAAAESERKKQQLYKEIPDLAELDRQIAGIGVQVMRCALMGGDVESEIARMRKEHTALRLRRGEILASYGYPADYTDIRYRCEACLDEGFIGTKMCECMRRELILMGYESSGIGSLMQTQSFDTFSLSYYTGEARDAMEKNLGVLQSFSRDFSARRSENWLMVGGTGLGKTHLSTAVARTVIDGGFDVVYVTAQQMFSDFEDSRFGRGEENRDERYMECDLLILDDLGTEMSNTFTVSCLYNVINTRINARRATIISTNLTPAELRSRYADRITSRLFGEFRPLLFSGTDIRQQKLRGQGKA